MGGWVSGSMGGSGQITNNLINLDIIKIIQFCLKIYDLKETPPPMGGWVSGSMGGSGQITNNLINLDIFKIIQFCLNIYDLKETPPMGGYMDSCVDEWVNGWGQFILLNIE